MERLVLPVLGLLIAAGGLLAVAALFLIGLEFDEAWILASHLSAFQGRIVPEMSQVITTGGAHFLIVGVFGLPGDQVVSLARGLSLVSLAGTLLLTERFIRPWILDVRARLIVILCVLATPGSVLLGGMGYGVALSFFLFMAGLVTWFSFERHALPRIGLAGLLFGLAFATRWTLLPVAPLLLLLCLVLPPGTRLRWLHGVALLGLSLVVFGALLLLQIGLGPATASTGAQTTLAANFNAAGVSDRLFPSPARATGFVTRYVTLVSVPMVLASCVAAIFLWPGFSRTQKLFLLALVSVGLLVAGAWMMRSPFLHTRYVWPSLLTVNLFCGLCLAFLYMQAAQAGREMAALLRLACLALPVGLAVETYANSFRLIVAGSGYETNNAGYSVQERHFDAFRLKREQVAIADVLVGTLGPGDVAHGFGLPAEWSVVQLALLSQRPVETLSVETAPDVPPSVIITHEFAGLSPGGRAWLQEVSSATETVYGYAIHTVDQAAYMPPVADYLVDDGIYLFSLRREQSLSGY